MPNLPRNEEQEKLRLAKVAKRDAAVLAAQKAKEAQERVMSDPRRIEALKRMQDFHIKGEEAKINATSKTRANSPQVREAAKKEYTDYQSKLKDDYITNKIKKEQLDYARGKPRAKGSIMRNPFNFLTNSPAMALQREIQDQEKYLAAKQNQPTGMKKGGSVKAMADGGAADEDLMRYREKIEKQRQKIKLDRAQGKKMFAGQRMSMPSHLQNAPGSLRYESVMADGPVRKDKSGKYVPVPESDMSPDLQAKRRAADVQRANAKRQQEGNYVARRAEKAESQKQVNAMYGMAKGGAVKSASSRADGCAVRGKTRA
jgi:hypothetical protein